MSIIAKIEGGNYSVSFPTVQDFRTIKQQLSLERRTAGYEAIPRGLPDNEFARWRKSVDDECEKIDPFAEFQELVNSLGAKTPEQTARNMAAQGDNLWLLYYSLLRRDNPTVTLDWVRNLVSRAMDEDQGALLGLREVNRAFIELIRSKKNEAHRPEGTAQRNGKETRRRTSKRST